MKIPELYEIRLAGHLSVSWAARFERLSMRHEPEGESILSGKVDYAELARRAFCSSRLGSRLLVHVGVNPSVVICSEVIVRSPS